MELGTNHYEIRARATDPRTGRRKEVRREKECSLKEAVALQLQWAEELRSADERPERMRLVTFARSWLAGKLDKSLLKPSTAAKNASVLELHVIPHLGDVYVDAIHPADVEQWLLGQLRREYAPGRKPRSGRSRAGLKGYTPGAVLGQLRVLRAP